MKNMITLALICFLSMNVAQRASAEEKFADGFILERQNIEKPTGAVEHCLMKKNSAGVPLPKVLVMKDRIEVLDDTGQIKTVIPIGGNLSEKKEVHVYQGEHGKVVGVHVTKGYSPSRESWTSGEYYILDADGNRTLDLKKFNDNTRPVPSPSGDYAVGWPGGETPGGPPIFYDADGVRNKWAHGFTGEGWPKMYATFDATFSPDGRHVAILAGNGDVASDPRMIVYDASGNKLFEKSDASKGFLFSPDSAHIAYYSSPTGKLGIIDISGNQLWEAGLRVLPKLFSGDGRLLLVITRESIGVVDAATGQMKWQWKADANSLTGRSAPRTSASWDGFTMRSVAATLDFSRIVVTATTLKDIPVEPGKPQRHAVSNRDHVLIFDKAGNLIHWENLPKGSFKIPSTQLEVSDDGQTVAVSMNEGIVRFSLKHK